MLTAAFSFADWDNVSLSNETLLDTVSRFVLAALLKHTGLLAQGCGEGRYCSAATSPVCTHTVPLYASTSAPSGTNHQSLSLRFTAAFIRCEIACWPVRTWTSSRPDRLRARGG